MTVASEVNRSGPYIGNGVTTIFNYGFRILDEAHIQVIRSQADVDTVLTLGGDYTVSGVGDDSGGAVTILVAPSAAQTITFIRSAPFTQEIDLENQGPFFAETVEGALDLAAMRDQQLREVLSRAVVLPASQAGLDPAAIVAAIINFSRVYLGAKDAPPATDNNGDALILGALYFDTIDNQLKAWNGTAWVDTSSSAAGDVPSFSTKAEAVASSVLTSRLRVEDEDAQATYSYDPATGSGATITIANGRKYRNIEKVLTPKMFNAIGDGVANDTQAIADFAAEIQWRGGARVELGDGKTYKVWSGAVPATQSALISLVGLKRLRMNFNGSKLVNPINFTANNIILYWMLMRDCVDVEIDSAMFDQSAYHVTDSTRGTHGIYLQDYCRDIKIENLVMTGGVTGLSVSRSGSFNRAFRARDIEFTGDLTNVYYGLNTQKNGDQVEARYRTRSAGRSYFAYNVRQHEVTLDSTNAGPFDDVLLKVYALSTESNDENTLSDIELNYSNLSRPVSNPGTGSLIRLGIDQETASSAAGFIRNIKLNVEINQGVPGQPVVLATTKATSTGASDTTARGHYIQNVEIGGVVYGYSLGTAAMELFTNNGLNSLGDFSGDNVSNIIFRDLEIYGTSTSININSACVDRALVFENTFAETTPSLGALPSRLLDASKNVRMGTFRSFFDSGTSGTNGYQAYKRLPDGGIEMWGVSQAASGANTTVNFPTSFSALPEVLITSGGAGLSTAINTTAISGSSFQINNPSASTVLVHWRAIGYI